MGAITKELLDRKSLILLSWNDVHPTTDGGFVYEEWVIVSICSRGRIWLCFGGGFA